MGDERQQHNQKKQAGEWRDGQAPSGPPQKDPQPDAQEARHQQEVGEEANVLDRGGYPADEQKLGEEQCRAGEHEPDAGIAQERHGGERRKRARRDGHGILAVVTAT